MKYSNLFSPIKVGNLTLKNRIVATPASSLCLTPEGYMNPEVIAYYELKARGGAAVVTLGESIVHRATGKSQNRQIAIDDENVVPGLMDMVDAIHRHGAAASIELTHGGKYAYIDTEWGVPNATTIKRYGPVSEKLRGFDIEEMPEDIIYMIVQAYADAADRAKRCGFDMILVHGGHGWLLHQFLSKSNNRKDKFGGKNLEDRARFPLMVLQAIRKAVGPDFPIEFRMSGAEDEYLPCGYDIKEGVAIAKLVEPYVNIIEVSAGDHNIPEAYVITHPSMFEPMGRNITLAAEVKKHVKCPIATVGALGDPDKMEEILVAGMADLVGVGRSLLCDPYFPKKAMIGREDEIVKCMRCFTCTSNLLTGKKPVCPLNPEIGREFEFKIPFPPTKQRKSVAIIGGGPAGMKCALEANRRGHDVILVERKNELGGAMNFSSNVPFKKELYRFRTGLIKEIQKTDIKVMTGVDGTSEFVKSLNPDVVVAAVGAEPIIPNIPGIKRDHVIIGADLGTDNCPTVKGCHVVVIGGGLVGCEAAVNLAWQNKDVTVVEMNKELAAETGLFSKWALHTELNKCVKAKTGVKAREITDDSVVIEYPDGTLEAIPADTVVIAVGLRSLVAKVEELRTIADEFYIIGDCKKPRKIQHAISEGLFCARDI